jgi:hypothetical protein
MILHDTSDTWRQEVRQQAYNALRVATLRENDVTPPHVLAYYLRSALAHGLTLLEVCAASGLCSSAVLELTDPAVAA